VHHEQHPARAQVARRGVADAVQQGTAVAARVPRARDAAGGKTIRLGRDVRRVGDDRVELLAGDRLEQIAAPGSDAGAVQGSVQPDRRDGPARDVDRGDLARAAERGAHRERAAPGAQVEHAGTRR
jgi:hypothetical protein